MGNRVVGPAPAPEGGYLMPSTAAFLGIAVGATVYFLLSKALGVHVEVWQGINTFTNPKWFAAVAVVPALSGFVTGIIAGHHGKWYAMIPVLLLHSADYAKLYNTPGAEQVVLGYGLFIFFMIIMLELALMAGWGGELIRARKAGEDARA